MYYFEKNDISIFSSIVYQVYHTEDLGTMRLGFLKSVRLLAPYESSNFYLADRSGRHLITEPVAVNFPTAALTEYLENIEEEDPTRWIFIEAKSMVYREKELFTPEAIEKNKCYQEFYLPHQLHHSLQISLALHETFLGSLSFYRLEEQEEFSNREMYFFDLFKEHLALRLYRELEKTAALDPARIDTAAAKARYGLTTRECEMARFLIDGLGIEEIGSSLYISPNTVKKHIVNLYRKLGIKSRRELNRKFT